MYTVGDNWLVCGMTPSVTKTSNSQTSWHRPKYSSPLPIRYSRGKKASPFKVSPPAPSLHPSPRTYAVLFCFSSFTLLSSSLEGPMRPRYQIPLSRTTTTPSPTSQPPLQPARHCICCPVPLCADCNIKQKIFRQELLFFLSFFRFVSSFLFNFSKFIILV